MGIHSASGGTHDFNIWWLVHLVADHLKIRKTSESSGMKPFWRETAGLNDSVGKYQAFCNLQPGVLLQWMRGSWASWANVVLR